MIFGIYVYDHKRKVKFKYGHTLPNSDRVMAPFYFEFGKNDDVWLEFGKMMMFG